MKLLQIFFSFRGRIGRKTYWLAGLALNIFGLCVHACVSYLLTGEFFSLYVWRMLPGGEQYWMPVWGAYYLAAIWPGIAVGMKRWHDRNRPAWLYLLLYALYFSPLAVAVMRIWRETLAGEHPFHADPLLPAHRTRLSQGHAG
jgi:uncharacterized membrane protein YhaH (DUF805 family)